MNNLSSSSALAQKYKDYVEIKVEEVHGFGDAYNLKPFDIEEESEDRVINIYANFPDEKDFVYEYDGFSKKNFNIETGLHVTIPDGYILYVFPDEQIYHSKPQIFVGYCYPFNICVSYKIPWGQSIKIKNEHLIAKACVVPFPFINTQNLEYVWTENISSKCKKILIKTNCGNKSSTISGGSGYSRPINTNNKGE